MYNNDQFDNQNQFVISYELLALLLWIIDNEEIGLKRLIKKAFAGGLQEALQDKPELNDAQLLDEAQQSIIDFFGILETHMLEAMQEQSIQQALEKNLIPAIDQIDMTSCDNATVRKSIESATSRNDNYSKEQAKQVLYKELLRNWKPQKNQLLN